MPRRHSQAMFFRGLLASACLTLLAACGADDEALVAPEAPVSLQIAGSAPADGQVSLTWSASSGATSYHLKRSTTNGGPYMQIAVTTATSIVDGSLLNGTTYYYVVAAGNAAGEGPASAQITATPQAPIVAPAAPGSPAATAGDAQVVLAWSASNGATSYNVKRSDDGGVAYQQVATRNTTSHVDTGLTNGHTYFYVVTAVNSAGESGNSGVISATPRPALTVPLPPGNVTATPGNAQVTLGWSASNGATGYLIRRSTTSGGPYTQIATSTSTSYTDLALANGTIYYYVIAAANSVGESGNSAPANATPVAITVPLPPANVMATAGDARVTLAWSASDGATSYNVKRSDDGGSTYQQVATRTTTSHVDAALTNGNNYFYAVTAVNAAGESSNSGVVGATPQPALTMPLPPGNVAAMAGNAQVSLSWSASNGATSYSIRRSTSSGGPYMQVATSTTTGYVDVLLTNGTPYYYIVMATNSVGQSGNSAQVSAIPVAPIVVPSPPGNVVATAGDARVALAWSASVGAASYKVKRSDDGGGTYQQVATLTTTSFVDVALTNGKPYFYLITAVNSAGESGNTGVVGATPQPAPAAPLPPASVAATAGNAQVSLTWSASNGATSYSIMRSTSSSGPFTQVAVSVLTGYFDILLANGTTYYYMVVATNPVGESANSAQVSVTPVAPIMVPSPPGNVTATAADARVTLAWSASNGATGYNVKRSGDGGMTYQQMATLATTSYVDTALANGSTYFYVVTAVNAAGESGNSAPVNATPLAPPIAPAAPGNVVATAGNAQVGLTWSASNGATSYSIRRATSSGGPYTQVAISVLTGYFDILLTNGTTYYYVVVAANAVGASGDSAQVSATPVAPIMLPSPPGNLVATAGDARVTLAWTASVGATSYSVKRSDDGGGTYHPVATRTTTSYVDTALTNGSTYFYVVTAVNPAGESGNSAQLGATPQAPPAAPSPPGNVAATAGNAEVSLTWSASSGATSYIARRSIASGGPYTQVAATASTAFTDSSVINGTTYYYVVLAINPAGESASSTPVSATPAAPVVPAATCDNLPPPGVWENVTPAGNSPLALNGTSGAGIIVDPFDARRVWLGTSIGNSEFWRSDNCGATWTNVRNGPGSIGIGAQWSMQADFVNPGVLYATSGYGAQSLWKTADGGHSWSDVFTGTEYERVAQDRFVNNVSMDPANHLHLVVSTHGLCAAPYAPSCIAETQDGGVTWQVLTAPEGWTEGGGLIVVNGGLWIWCGTQMLVTKDGGRTWTRTLTGDDTCESEFTIRSFVPASNGKYYLGSRTGVLWSSNGEAWQHVQGTSGALVMIAQGSRRVFASSQWQPIIKWASLDNDTVWHDIPAPPQLVLGGAGGIAFMAYDDVRGILYASMFNGGVARMVIPQ